MSAVAAAAATVVSPDEAGRLFESSGSTLEDAVLGAWEDLGLEGETGCPVCHGRLEPAGCRDCGSELT